MANESNLKFPFKIAFLNSLGFALSILYPNYIDSNTTNSLYNNMAPSYHYGYWWSVLALLIFPSTLYLVKRAISGGLGYWCAFLPLVICGVVSLFDFNYHGIPNMGVAGFVFGTFLISFLTIWIRFSREDTAYLYMPDIDASAKADRLRAQISLWQEVTFYGAGGYMAFVITWLVFISDSGKIMFTSGHDQLLFKSAIASVAFLATLAVIFGPLSEAFRKTTKLIANLSDIKTTHRV